MGANEPSDFNADRAELFEALGHPTRIRILEALSEGSLGFSEVKRRVGLESNGLLSFHLGKLDNLVRLTQEGSYAITDQGREALRVVRTASSPEGRVDVTKATQQGSTGRGSSDTSMEAAFYRQRRYQAALAVIVALLLVGVATLYLSATAQSSDVVLDFTGQGRMVGWNVYNNASPPLSIDITVNGSQMVHVTSAPPPTETIYYAYLPNGLAVTQGSVFNVTVAVSFSQGSTLVKSILLNGLTSTTLHFSG